MDEPDLYSLDETCSSRFLVLNAKHVRRFLATGVIDLPVEADMFTSTFDHIGEGRRLLSEGDLGTIIEVVSVKDACVAQLSDRLVLDDPDMLNIPIPAFLIEGLLFSSVQQANDWSGRSKNFPGIGPLPRTEFRQGLEFCKVDRSDSTDTSTGVAVDHGDLVTELQRLSGALIALLSSSNSGSEWMRSLAEEPLGRAHLADLLGTFCGQVSERIEKVLSILEMPEWGNQTGMFDVRAMLERLTAELSCDGDQEKVHAWSSYVVGVLDDARDADADEFLDAGDILLRALQFMVRTKPLSIENIDEQIRNYDGRIGRKVGTLARVLTGWYQGFLHLAGDAKESPLYSIGSRIAAGCPDHPIHFEYDQTDVGTFDVRSFLIEDGVELASHQDSPSPALKEFFHAAQSVFHDQDWRVEYSRLDREMHFRKGDDLVVGTIEGSIGSGQCVHLKSVLDLKRPRARGWLKGFEGELLKLGHELRCAISTPGYPEVSFHCHQLAATTDHDEILFHLEAIFEGKRKVHVMHQAMLG